VCSSKMSTLVSDSKKQVRDPLSPDWYFKDASLPKLTGNEVQALSDRTHKGGDKGFVAATELLTRNFGLAVKISHGYMPIVPHGGDLRDLVQEALIMIWKSLEGFNPKKGGISPWIGGALRNGLSKKIPFYASVVKATPWAVRAKKEFDKAYHSLSAELKAAPSDELLADELGWPLSKVRTIQSLTRCLPLDAQIHPDDYKTWQDVLVDPATQNERDPLYEERLAKVSMVLKKLVSRLPAPRDEILKHRFGIFGYTGKTLEETAAHLGIKSHQLVRHHQQKGLAQLKELAEEFLSTGRLPEKLPAIRGVS
jgi:RNA polymerase sigma factor (sigma-70 family)